MKRVEVDARWVKGYYTVPNLSIVAANKHRNLGFTLYKRGNYDAWLEDLRLRYCLARIRINVFSMQINMLQRFPRLKWVIRQNFHSPIRYYVEAYRSLHEIK